LPLSTPRAIIRHQRRGGQPKTAAPISALLGGDPEAQAILNDGCVDLGDLAERLDFIGPKVGKLRGHKVVRVDPNDAMAVSKARAAIKDRHKSWAKNKVDKTGCGGDGTAVLTILRISELERYLRLRYGTVLPDDDAGHDDLVILLNHVAHNRTDPRGKMLGYVLRWAPLMPSNESEALIDMILAAPRKYTPKRLGELLRLTEAERDQECITTIRAFDSTPESMAANAKRKDRERKVAARAENKSERPRGRPRLELSPEEMAVRIKAQNAERARRRRASRKNASEALEGLSNALDGIKRDGLPAVEPGALQARRRPEPIDVDDMGDDDDVDGMIQIEVDGALIWVPADNGTGSPESARLR
jgi:hypothetical protein